jgi:hypothetical protein
MTDSTITFVCWEKDEPLEIQLEPECFLFKVLPGNELTFKGIPLGDKPFEWALRVDRHGVQLIPDHWPYEIKVFENGMLLEDWYKYMR